MEGDPLRIYERPRITEELKPELRIRPWIDELVESLGYGPRSMYVETCWLPVLGPTATWLYRRLGSWAEYNDDGLMLDAVDLAVSLGLGEGLGKNSMLAKALDRLVRFDVARWSQDELQVRRALPPLPERLAKGLSYTTRRLHEGYTQRPHQPLHSIPAE